ncbi:alpha/beta fold hydrolase [Oerskovia sp. KBS0722]|uniref:alpha/beta fold hydrolase n=1 Tax=Oerskovia sp. KBS0722 TaxID=1179673 RepID=UPI00110ECC52|nr:alpha/beta hydrolase [Oerskovia sp. KBS0722]QDW62615.1 alpha/beta hydrolase [Oerskovia sp. KBS0722]
MGLPVLFVHGSRTSRTMWRAQLEAMDRAGIVAEAVDLPGHGERTGEAFTLDGAVATVARAVDDLGGRALVVGLSLGGYVGIEHRARLPEQVAGLVAASCCTVPASRLRVAWRVAADRIEKLPDSGAALNQALVRRTLPAAGVEDIGAGGFALTTMTAILDEVGRTEPLAALSVTDSPVWFVNGRWDHFRFGERAYLAAARSGGARAELVVVPGAKHLVSLDRPVAFTRAVLAAHHELDPS